jgi:hypothetical protein
MILRALLIFSTFIMYGCTCMHTGVVVVPEAGPVASIKPTSVYNVVKINF